MVRAIWQDTVIAESDHTIEVDGYHYFPSTAVRRLYLRDSATRSTCSWKGEAIYFDVVVDGNVNKDAAWTYPSPLEAARRIQGHIAFWNGITIEP